MGEDGSGRATAVREYCARLCPPHAVPDAVDAALATADQPDPDERLLEATRIVAAERAATPASGAPQGTSKLRRRIADVTGISPCEVMPRLLAARASGTLSPREGERMSRHLRRCSACQAAELRFVEAEHAFQVAREGRSETDLAAWPTGAESEAREPIRPEQTPPGRELPGPPPPVAVSAEDTAPYDAVPAREPEGQRQSPREAWLPRSTPRSVPVFAGASAPATERKGLRARLRGLGGRRRQRHETAGGGRGAGVGPGLRPPPSATSQRRLPQARWIATGIAAVLLAAAGVTAAALFLGNDSGQETPATVEQPPPRDTAGTERGPEQPSDVAPVDPASVTVSVLNAADVDLLAADVSDQLSEAGFETVGTSDAPEQATRSIVYYNPGEKRAGATVGRELDVGRVRPLKDSPQQAQLEELGGGADVIVLAGSELEQ